MKQTIRRVTLAIAFAILFAAGVSAQDESKGACQVKVVVARVNWDGGGDPQFGRMSNDQIQWWWKDGQKKFPKICLVYNKDEADYAVAWKSLQGADKYSYRVPKTETTYHSGTVNGTATQIGSNPTNTSGTYSGTSTTTTYEKREGEWPVVYVNAAVYHNDGPDMPVFITKHKGQWRWSKPDKDAFQKALEWINKQISK
jgi:hypothetical protein